MLYLSLALIMQIFVLTHMVSFKVHHILFVMIQGLLMLKDNYSVYHLCIV